MVGVPATRDLLTGPHTKVTPSVATVTSTTQTKLGGFFAVANPYKCLSPYGCPARMSTPQPLCDACVRVPGLVPLALLCAAVVAREAEAVLARVRAARVRIQTSAPRVFEPVSTNWQYQLAWAATAHERAVETLGRFAAVEAAHKPDLCCHGSGPECVACEALARRRDRRVKRRVHASTGAPPVVVPPSPVHPAHTPSVEIVPAPTPAPVAAPLPLPPLSPSGCANTAPAAPPVTAVDVKPVPASVSVPSGRPRRQKWCCAVCTYENKAGAAACGMCGAPKPPT